MKVGSRGREGQMGRSGGVKGFSVMGFELPCEGRSEVS